MVKKRKLRWFGNIPRSCLSKFYITAHNESKMKKSKVEEGEGRQYEKVDRDGHCGNSVVVPQFYTLLCPCVYSLQHYGQLPIMLHFLFCLKLKTEKR